ncbi:MAG TPA: HAMP domain-containing histidine kinase [Euryarchaeota archaeon]|nr:HAMP domain-containing histidine kinase [Euryarchaeota archaeon]
MMINEKVSKFYKNPLDRERFIEALKKTGKVSNFEIEVTTNKGREKNIVISASRDGENITGMAMDVTKKKVAESEREEIIKDLEQSKSAVLNMLSDLDKSHRNLESAYKNLKETELVKDEFLQNVTHELRTPITAMLTTIRLLKDELKDDKLSKLLELNERSTWRLNRIVGSILDFASIERGSMKLRVQIINVEAEINEAVNNIRGMAKDRGITLSSKLPEKDIPVIGDSDAIQMILGNLLNNAIKFNESGGSVTITARQKDGFVEVSISDTGIGIPVAEAEKIFDTFYQIDGKTTRSYPGTGIGLSITKRLVEMQGGTISLKSGVGKGSIFSFTIPIFES